MGSMLSKCYGDDAQLDARAPPPPAPAADGHSHSHEHGDHSSEVVALGTVTLAGCAFAVCAKLCVSLTDTVRFGICVRTEVFPG